MSFPATPTNNQTFTTTDGRTYKYSQVSNEWNFQGVNISSTKNNYLASNPPTSSADSSSGYSIGSIWIDVTSNKVYTCVDASPAAAIWSSGGATVATTLPIRASLGQIVLNTTDGRAYIWNGTAWVDVTAAGGALPQNNYSATTNPLITSDSVAGYSPGSTWVNVTSNAVFKCTNASTGAAVWKDLRAIGDGQVWTDQTLTRVLGTIYTNTSSRPITMNVKLSNVAAVLGSAAIATVGGVIISGDTLNTGTTLPAFTSVTTVVPVGATYSVTYGGLTVGVTLTSWMELI